MAHESNWAGNFGIHSAPQSQSDFMKRGLSSDQASEAYAAQKRAGMHG